MVIQSENNCSYAGNKNIIHGPPLDYEPDSRGVGYVLWSSMKKYKEKIAQYIEDTGETDSYAELLEKCVRVATKLTKRSITSQDVIIICSNNHRNTCLPHLASIFNGTKIACLDPTLSLADTKYLTDLVKPKAAFVTPNATQLIETAFKENGIQAEIVVFGDTEIHTPFSEFLEPDVDEGSFVPRQPDDLNETMAIFFSSGTTGSPKGIRLSHRTFLVQKENFHRLIGGNSYYKSETVHLVYSTFYWISATLIIICSVHSGSARLISSNFEAAKFWHCINKYKVTMCFLSPTQTCQLARLGKPEGLDISYLKYMLTGGSAVSEQILEKLRQICPTAWITQGYGSTECGGVITCFSEFMPNHPEYLKSKPQSCGDVIWGISYKVVDPETEEALGPYQQGEIRLKSNFFTVGYYNMDSSSAFDCEGWLQTGDIGYYDDDHCFYIVDRLKEMIKYRGYQIAPATLEKILVQHPAVRQAVILGLPHPEDVEHPIALVVLEDKFKDITTDEIANFVNKQVSDAQQLRGGVKFVKEIPLTPSGKAQRREMKRMILANEL